MLWLLFVVEYWGLIFIVFLDIVWVWYCYLLFFVCYVRDCVGVCNLEIDYSFILNFNCIDMEKLWKWRYLDVDFVINFMESIIKLLLYDFCFKYDLEVVVGR